MIKNILLLSLVVGMVSCQSTYFFSTLDTTGRYMEKAENGDFMLDGDSLWIKYSFRGQDAPVQVTVYNKMSKPLYVDWSQSALVINNIAYYYSGNQLPSEDVSNYFEDKGSGSFSVPVIDAESDGFVTKINPKRLVTYSTLRLNVSFNGMKSKAFRTKTMEDDSGKTVKVKNADFSLENTPLLFSSYLTTYTKVDNPIVYEQDFYISNLIKSKSISPQTLPVYMVNRGDIFYVEKPANTSLIQTLLGTTMQIGAMALELALDAALEPK